MENRPKECMACIIDNLLYYGNIMPAFSEKFLSNLGIKSIVCLLSKKIKLVHSKEFSVLDIITDDLVTCSINEWAEKTSDFIDESINNNNPVYVHCYQGISRSTACVLHYLMTKRKMNLKDSFSLVKSKRKVACPNIGFFKDLVDLDKKLYGTNSMTLQEYSIMAISENFPTLDKEEIENTYNKYYELYTNGEKKDEYKKEMETNGYEPIGYHTLDELKEGIGKDKFIPRKGTSVHHPFN